jgi:hypothetical protein
MVTMHPSGSPVGSALVCYGTTVYLRFTQGLPFDKSHVSAFKNYNLTRALLDLGFVVDVIDYDDYAAKPRKNYDLVIDSGDALELLAPQLSKTCYKVLCPEFGHWSIHNSGSYLRHLQLLRRRGRSLKPSRLLKPNLGTELAQHILCAGGQFTAEGYGYCGTPVTPLNQTAPYMPQNRVDKDYKAIRNRFLWISGSGLVHKGLDLVLEAFAQMPDAELVVCCNLETEKDFEDIYSKELYETPNI